MTDIWGPLLLSLRIAVLATALAAAIGIPLALLMSRRRFRGKSLLEAVIVLPLAMPPTVLGYGIIRLLGRQGIIGRVLFQATGYSLLFRVEGAILAAAVVALPLLYLPAKAAFAAVDRELEDSARLMGAGRWQTFWQLSLPLARRGIYSGLLLSFARAIGEFGATVMVLGIQPGRITLPVSIYTDFEQGDLDHARFAVRALALLSLALVMAYNRSAVSVQERE